MIDTDQFLPRLEQMHASLISHNNSTLTLQEYKRYMLTNIVSNMSIPRILTVPIELLLRDARIFYNVDFSQVDFSNFRGIFSGINRLKNRQLFYNCNFRGADVSDEQNDITGPDYDDDYDEDDDDDSDPTDNSANMDQNIPFIGTFDKCDMRDMNFTFASLKVHVFNSNMAGSIFRDAFLYESKFDTVNFRESLISRSWAKLREFTNCDFSGLDLGCDDGDNHFDPEYYGIYKNCKFISTIWSSPEILLGDFTGSDFSSATITGVDFSSSTFNGCNFTNTNASNSSFDTCKFKGANFYNANFTGSFLNNVHLNGASLINTNFTNATISLYPIRDHSRIILKVQGVQLHGAQIDSKLHAYMKTQLLKDEIRQVTDFHPNNDPKSIFGKEYRKSTQRYHEKFNNAYGRRSTKRNINNNSTSKKRNINALNSEKKSSSSKKQSSSSKTQSSSSETKRSTKKSKKELKK